MVTVTTLNDISPRSIGDITITSTPFEVTIASGTLSIENNAVSSVNSQTGAVVLDSDDISEGTTNFYYTGARFTADFNTKTTDDLSEGSTNLYSTPARTRAALSASGDLIYDPNTGQFSVTTYKSTDFDSDFAAKSTTNLSEGTNLYYTNARADARVDLQTGANLDLSQKSTTDLAEGTNQYFTDARADARVDLQTGANLDLSFKDTDDLAEGLTNQYYTSARFNSDFATKSTTDLSEGTNLYYTNARTDARVDLQTGANLDLSQKSTTDLSEGTNLYYTDVRADARVDLQTGANLDLSQKSTDDLAEGATNQYFTAERVDDRVSNLIVGGSNITVTYDDNLNQLSISADTGSLGYDLSANSTDDLAEGTTNLYYTNTRVQSYLTANDYATNTDVSTAISGLVDSAPTTLDTLNELAAALGDDPNFATTVSNQLGNKLNTADFDSTADTWIGTKSTTDLSEGTNLYYTDARARAALSGAGDITYNSTTGEISVTTYKTADFNTDFATKSTTDLSEGTNLYYTDVRADARVDLATGANLDLSQKDTDDLAEGLANQYYTDARARSALSAGGDITYNSTTGEISVTTYKSTDFDSDFAAKSTTDLSEGTNLYYTNARADARVDLQTGANLDLSQKSTTDLSEGTNLYYTDTRARNSISATGDIQYNSTTGVISYTTPAIPSDVSDLTDSTGLLAQDDLSNNTTTDLAEGDNLYYTDARVQTVINTNTAGFITELLEDTTPVLGGNLDVNSNAIVSTANGNIAITPDGTGSVVLDGQSWPQSAPATNGEYLEGNADGTLLWTDRVNAKTIYETVKNTSGVELTKGTPVYQLSVTVGNTITVGAARADDPAKLAIGVLDETLANEAEGRMLVLGEITGVNTAGFTAGDAVYLGATGGYTNVKPTASGVAVQFLGVVNRVDAANGSGYITGTLQPDTVRWTGTQFEGWTGTAWQTTTELSTDATPVLGGNLDANSNNITGVNNITVADTVTTNTIVGSGVGAFNGAPRFPNGIDLDGSGLISSHDGSLQRIDINGGVDSSSNSGGSYNFIAENLSSTGRGLSASVGTSGTAADANAIILQAKSSTAGGFQNRFIVLSDGRVQINDSYTLPTADGTNGQVLTTDGAGNITFTTPTGGGASTLDDLTDVTIATPADGEALIYNSTSSVWENTALPATELSEDTTPVLGGDLNGAGNTIQNFTLTDYVEEIHDLGTVSGTLSIQGANGPVQTATLSGNITINGLETLGGGSPDAAGRTVTVILKQDATGSRTLSSTMLFAGGEKTLSTDPNAVDILTIFAADSSTYYASLAKGFS